MSIGLPASKFGLTMPQLLQLAHVNEMSLSLSHFTGMLLIGSLLMTLGARRTALR